MTSDTGTIRAIEAVGAGDVASVGGKAANLGEVLRAKIPLPSGFCVPAEVYARFVASGAVAAVLDSTLALPEDALARDLDGCSRAIRNAFRAAPVPEDVRAAVASAYEALAGERGPVAVRSSATAEDLPDASFAGQQETYLNVRGADAVVDAVRECWGSLWTPRAIAYRARQGYRHADVRLAVVVQRMVQSDVSGVLFTVDPMDARRTQMLANASFGLGEAIVSGRVTPDTYALSRAGAPVVVKKTLGTKAVRIDGVPTGGTEEREVSAPDRARFCLDEAALVALRDTALRVEAHFGCPQDLEWAFEGGTLHVLQSRPITSLPPEVPDFSRLSRLERFVLDDILEHFPEAPHPLDHAAVVDTYDQVQALFGEVGVTASPASSIVRLSDEGLCAVVPRAPRTTWRVLGLPFALLAKLRAPAGVWTREHATPVADALDALRGEDLATDDDAALAAFFDRAVALASRVGALRFSLVIGPLLLAAGLLGVFARLARRKVGEFEWLAGLSYHTVETELAIQELADHASARPALRDALLRARAADVTLEGLAPDDAVWTALVRGFVARYGARTMRLYLPFTARAWSEDEAALVATVQALVRADRPGAAQARMAAGRARFEALRADVLTRLPCFLRGPASRAIERFRALHVEREATVFEIERAYVQARRAVAEMGRRLAGRGALPSAPDTLWLTSPELLALLTGALERAEARRRIVRRKERRAAAVAYWQAHRLRTEVSLADVTLSGQAGSPGVAEGRVRVVRSPEEFAKLEPGDVLVCPFTDPAWTPLFALASAVVADTGGPLSHAAIVAREYGIPAVLGVQRGTLELRDGDLVRVDGLRGVVERRDAPTSP